MNADDRQERDDALPPPHECEETPKTVSTQDLFAGTREIHIDHEGEIYRLRITRRGKLILQK